MDKYNDQNLLIAKKQFSQNSKFSDEWICDNELKGKTKRSHPGINKDVAALYVTETEERIEHKKIINKLQNWLIFTMNK